jgi:L-lactate utilization protein LutC
VCTPTALRSQDVSSFEERQDSVRQESVNEEKTEEKPEEVAKLKKFEYMFRPTAEELRRKQSRQTKKEDEDPQIEQFKNAEVTLVVCQIFFRKLLTFCSPHADCR